MNPNPRRGAADAGEMLPFGSESSTLPNGALASVAGVTCARKPNSSVSRTASLLTTARSPDASLSRLI